MNYEKLKVKFEGSVALMQNQENISDTEVVANIIFGLLEYAALKESDYLQPADIVKMSEESISELLKIFCRAGSGKGILGYLSTFLTAINTSKFISNNSGEIVKCNQIISDLDKFIEANSDLERKLKEVNGELIKKQEEAKRINDVLVQIEKEQTELKQCIAWQGSGVENGQVSYNAAGVKFDDELRKILLTLGIGDSVRRMLNGERGKTLAEEFKKKVSDSKIQRIEATLSY